MYYTHSIYISQCDSVCMSHGDLPEAIENFAVPLCSGVRGDICRDVTQTVPNEFLINVIVIGQRHCESCMVGALV